MWCCGLNPRRYKEYRNLKESQGNVISIYNMKKSWILRGEEELDTGN